MGRETSIRPVCIPSLSAVFESPFFLLYGRDPRLPTPAVLSWKESFTVRDLKEYGVELYSRMSEAWELARQQITSRAQKHQKKVYDQGSKNPGVTVFLFKPAELTGARRKFARPFHGPYRLLEVGTNTARICPVDRPQSEPILVSLDRLRHCPEEVTDEFWPPGKTSQKTRHFPQESRAYPKPPADQEGAGGSGQQEQTMGGSTQELNEAEAGTGDDGDEDSHNHDGERTMGDASGKPLSPTGLEEDVQPYIQSTGKGAQGGGLDSEGGEANLPPPTPDQREENVRENTDERISSREGEGIGRTAMPTKDSTETITSQALQADENPWTTANNQDVDSSTQQGDKSSNR